MIAIVIWYLLRKDNKESFAIGEQLRSVMICYSIQKSDSDVYYKSQVILVRRLSISL